MSLSQQTSAKFPASAAVAALIAALVTFVWADNVWSWTGLVFFLVSWLAATVIIAFAWAATTSKD